MTDATKAAEARVRGAQLDLARARIAQVEVEVQQKAREKVCRKNGGHFPADAKGHDTVCLACGRHMAWSYDHYAMEY